MKIGVIILARANYGRWPDKVLYRLQGITILEHVICKAKQLNVYDNVIVSTTDNEEDLIIRIIAQRMNAKLSIGPAEDRTARYCQAIHEYNLDYFLSISPAIPFFDVEYTNRLIDAARLNPGNDMYAIGGHTNSAIPRIFNGKLPCNSTNPDQEIFVDGIKKVYTHYNWWDSEIKNRYLFNCNIAFWLHADNHRRICEYLGHFPKDYDEVVRALMGIGERFKP